MKNHSGPSLCHFTFSLVSDPKGHFIGLFHRPMAVIGTCTITSSFYQIKHFQLVLKRFTRSVSASHSLSLRQSRNVGVFFPLLSTRIYSNLCWLELFSPVLDINFNLIFPLSKWQGGSQCRCCLYLFTMKVIFRMSVIPCPFEYTEVH